MKNKIVIVEDNEEILFVLEEVISSVIPNHNVITFENGDEAWKYICNNDNSIDIAILDHMIPGMKGGEICLKMKESEKLKDIPVIIQSGKVDLSNSDMLNKFGASIYKVKPYPMSELVEDINKVLSLRENN